MVQAYDWYGFWRTCCIANNFLFLCKLKSKGIKKTSKILLIIATSVVILLITPFILLQNNKIQNFIVDLLTRELSEKYQTNISIGSIDYRFFNQLKMQQLYVEDQQGDTLLYVDRLNAGFEFWKFFRGRIVFSHFELQQLYANISTDTTGVNNFDFLFVDDKERADSTMIDLRLDRVKLQNSTLHYSHAADSGLHDRLNLKHLRIHDINTDFSIKAFNQDSINFSIKHFSAYEQSGLTIKNLQLQLSGSSSFIRVPVLRVELPNSKMKLNDLHFEIESLTDLKNTIGNTRFHVPIDNLQLSFSDLEAILPGFKNAQEIITLNALVTGRLSNLRIQQVKAEFGSSFELEGSLDINGLPNFQESFIYGDIRELKINHSELQDVIARIQNKPFLFPKEFRHLGTLSYTGNVTGFVSDLVAYGNLRTQLGSISSDLSLRFENNLQDVFYRGSLRTSNFALGKYFSTPELGKIAIQINTTGTKLNEQALKGTIRAKLNTLELNAYQYTNALFEGQYNGTGFNGNINIKDENIDADFTGVIDFRDPKVPIFDFDLKVTETNLHALHLIEDYPGARISFHGKTNMSGSSLDNLNGLLYFEDIQFTNKDKTLNGKQITFNSRTETDHTRFSIESDYVNGSFAGNFKYSTIGNTFKQVISKYLPSLSDNGAMVKHAPNIIAIDLSIENTDEISAVLELPYRLEGRSTITGWIDESLNQVDIVARVNALQTELQIFEQLTVNLENKNQTLQMTGRTQMYVKNGSFFNVFLSADAAKDLLSAKLIWQNNESVTNAGEIATSTLFSKTAGALKAHTHLQPSQIIISDSIWQLRASDVYFEPDTVIRLENFRFENGQQYIYANGRISKEQNDSLIVTMNDLNLDYLMHLIRLRGINFSGNATGKIKMYNLLQEPIYLADIHVKDYSINNAIVADAYLQTNWDKINKQLVITGDFVNEQKELVAKGTGIYVPANDSLDIELDARKFSVAFLNRYFEGVANNFRGNADGKFRIFGPLKEIRFAGDLYVSNGRVSIDLLKTTYSFNDRVVLTPDEIRLNNILIFDAENNQGILNGSILHDGTFGKMIYDVRIVTENLMAMNTRSTDDDFFYGRAYLGGLVNIFGNDNEANIVVNGISRPNTKCFMSMGNTSSVMESDFVQFVQRRTFNFEEEGMQEVRREFVNNNSNFNVKVDMQIELTPDAEMDIIVDPNAGDKITGRGRGNLRIVFDTFSDVEMYGTVELEQGYYLFTLQTVIRKEFKINDGSTIAWTGDPFEAQVNINGYYPLTASLADLIEREELQQVTNRSTVPVHCLLYLTEDLMAPKIRFGIDLPASDESLKSRVKNIINTEEMMNRQILYLLLFHKFFTPDYMRTTAAVGANEGWSFAAATLSAQFNNWIQTSLNTNVFSFGLDWQKTDIESDEVKAQILIQPNNRLVINGNIGYRNDNISENKFIGDFDLEYKLIESGKLRFTAYNHTIDRAQLREAKTTQGVGLIYREDFNDLRELFEYYWNIFKSLFAGKAEKKEELVVSQ